MEEKFLQEEEPEAEKNSLFRTRRNSNSTSESKPFADFDVSLLKERNTFTKAEKLKSKKIIEQLFTEGKSVSANGFTLVYLVQPLPTFFPAQAGFSVPKKFFRHAVERNRIKRLMREVYRTNKVLLYEKLAERKVQMAIMFVYKGKSLPDLDAVTKAVLTCLQKVIKP